MRSMRPRAGPRRAGQGEQSRQPNSPGRGTGWAALLGALVVVLGAAASIIDKHESLRRVWVLLIVAGAVVGLPATLLASPWWQHRQATRHAQEELVAARARKQARDQRDHFDPRGRGVLPFAGRRGWYFTGRTQALRELAGWLATPPDRQPAMRVVTGAPGSGKSAVLGRLVLLADPARRQAALVAEPHLDEAMLPPAGSIDLSVHARGRTTQEIVDAVAATAGVEAANVEDLLDALEGRAQPVVVVVDAVDEAGRPEELADLLARLVQTGGLRLLVGIRRHLVDRLVALDQPLDLDNPRYLGADDVAGYVRRCLLLDGDPETPTPYRGRSKLAGQVADAVATRAGASFLIAQLVSLALINAGQVVDVTEPGWRERFPREVRQAVRAYLDGFGPNRSRARDLLVPLAFAEGDGLADAAVWAALASEIGTSTYQPQDVRWLLADTSAPNLLQPTRLREGTFAWRLFHQALAEYLRDQELPVVAREVQRRITQVLSGRVPHHSGRPDWLAADAYTRSHLPAHAAAAGLLDDLVVDPGVLLVAEPARLLPLLHTVTSPPAWVAGRAYRQAVHQLGSERPLAQRASCLQRAARYCGANDLADRIAALRITLPWMTRWAGWQVTGTSRQLIGHTGEVRGVAFGQVDGEPVIVSGAVDETVRVWDAGTGEARGVPLTGHINAVSGVAFGQVDGEPVIVSASDDGTVRVWDARTGQPRGAPLTGHINAVNGVAFGQVDGEPVIVSGGADETVRVWDARTGQPRGAPLTGHTDTVVVVAFGQVDGEPVIVSGGADETVRVWDAGTGQPRGVPLTGHTDWVTGVAFGEVDGEPVIVSGAVMGRCGCGMPAPARPAVCPSPAGHARSLWWRLVRWTASR